MISFLGIEGKVVEIAIIVDALAVGVLKTVEINEVA